MTEIKFYGRPDVTDLWMPPHEYNELNHVDCCKYASWDYVWDRCNSSYVRAVLALFPVDREKVLIDIKVHDLKTGDHPCIPGWHLDGTDIEEYEYFYLFVSGETRTQFVNHDLYEEVNSTKCGQITADLGPKLNRNNYLPAWKVPNCRIVGPYTNLHFHRSQSASGPERRLLIRAAMSPKIHPRNQVFIPQTYSMPGRII